MRRIIVAASVFSLAGCAQVAKTLDGTIGSNVSAAIGGAQFPSGTPPPGVNFSDPNYGYLEHAMVASLGEQDNQNFAKTFYRQGLLVGKMNCRAYIDGMAVADRTLDTGQFTISLLSTITNGLLSTFGAGTGAFNGLNIGTNAAQSALHFTSSEFTFDVGQDNIDQLITKNMQNAAEVTAGADGAKINTYQDAYNALLNGMDACKLTQIKYALAAAVQQAAPKGTPADLPSINASNDSAGKNTADTATKQ